MISLIMGSHILKILSVELSKTILAKEFSSVAIMKLKQSFRYIDDKMPVGNRILFFDKENFENSFHVFVPNYSENMCPKIIVILSIGNALNQDFQKGIKVYRSNYNC